MGSVVDEARMKSGVFRGSPVLYTGAWAPCFGFLRRSGFRGGWPGGTPPASAAGRQGSLQPLITLPVSMCMLSRSSRFAIEAKFLRPIHEIRLLVDSFVKY